MPGTSTSTHPTQPIAFTQPMALVVLQSPPDRAEALLADVLRHEASLSDAEQRLAVLTRLQAWLSMTDEDLAAVVARYRVAFKRLELHEREAIVAAERDAALHALRYDEYARLCRFATWLQEGELLLTPPKRGDFWANLTFALAVTADVAA